MLFNKNNNGTAEIAKYATWTSNHDFNHVYPSLLLAEKRLINIIGDKTYDVANTHYNSSDYEKTTSPNVILDTLVHSIQVVLVNIAYQKNMAKDSVLWDNAGINVVWSENLRPAQKQTLDSLHESLSVDSYSFIDILIEYLIKNKDTFTDFATSIEALRLKELFIDDANDFDFYFNINYSTAYFFELLDIIRRFQKNEIRNVLGNELYIKCTNYQIKRNEISNAKTPVQTFSELALITSVDGDVRGVLDEGKYYVYSSSLWLFLAEDMKPYMSLIKPALVDLTMSHKLSSIKDSRPEFVETLNVRGQSGLKILSDYIKSLIVGNTIIDDNQYAPEVIRTNNTFSI